MEWTETILKVTYNFHNIIISILTDRKMFAAVQLVWPQVWNITNKSQQTQ